MVGRFDGLLVLEWIRMGGCETGLLSFQQTQTADVMVLVISTVTLTGCQVWRLHRLVAALPVVGLNPLQFVLVRIDWQDFQE